MKIFVVFFITMTFTCHAFAQNSGFLVHYQKKAENCLFIPSEKFEASYFTIYCDKSAYSNGRIQIKKIKQANFEVHNLVYLFEQENFTSTTFVIKGKQNIELFEKWIQTKIPNLVGEIDTTIDLNEQKIHVFIQKKGRKMNVKIQVTK
jgi:hypothetical protein